MRRWLAAVWIIAIWFTSDSPTALFRRPPEAQSDSTATDPRTTLRIVSFNTGSAPPGDLEKIARWRPDIVLLQETYSRQAVAQMADELFGEACGYVWNSENSILARGSVKAVPNDNPALQSFAVAEVRLINRPALLVANVRLNPQPVRFDFWSEDCWATYAKLRRQHRETLKSLLAHINQHAGNSPVLIAGDFNAPAGDAIFRLMPPQYTDAFHAAGRGWGCTLPNELPLLRIDQIWVSPELQPIVAWAVTSERSDHRMVIADLRVSR